MSNVAYRDLEDSFEDDNNTTSCFGLVTIFFLGTCCAIGIFAGVYLMMTEDIFREDHAFTIIPNNNNWDLHDSPPFLKIPAKKIFIAATNTSECLNVQDNKNNNCSHNFKNNFTKDEFKKLYNFLVNKDGVILEGLGWNQPCRQSPNCDNSSISIAFIGEFADDNCPKSGAVQAVINFVESSQTNSKIIKCFMTIVDLNINKSSNWCLLQVASNVQEVTKKYGC